MKTKIDRLQDRAVEYRDTNKSAIKKFVKDIDKKNQAPAQLACEQHIQFEIQKFEYLRRTHESIPTLSRYGQFFFNMKYLKPHQRKTLPCFDYMSKKDYARRVEDFILNMNKRLESDIKYIANHFGYSIEELTAGFEAVFNDMRNNPDVALLKD
jgi:hypothetical protein